MKSCAGRQRGKTVALMKLDRNLMPGGVFPGHGQSVGRNIESMDSGFGRVDGQSHGEATAAGAEVEGADGLFVGLDKLGKVFPGAFGQKLSFGSRNEDLGIDGYFQTAKGSRAQNILERFAGTAPLHEAAGDIQLFRGKLALEAQIELHARHLEHVGQDQLHLQARRGNAFACQKIGAFLNDFQNLHQSRK